MVLDLKKPSGANWHSLVSLWPVLISYIVSYLFIAIVWVNHHYRKAFPTTGRMLFLKGSEPASLIAGNIIKESRRAGLLRRSIAIGYAASLRLRDLTTIHFSEPFGSRKEDCKCFNQTIHKSRF
jgi:hypothetical protein